MAMTRFLIEVAEQSPTLAIERIKDAVRTMGSHFVSRATWTRTEAGCTGSLLVEAHDRRAALGLVPPNMRSHARIFQLEPLGTTWAARRGKVGTMIPAGMVRGCQAANVSPTSGATGAADEEFTHGSNALDRRS
jgi:hypothetical protein